MSQTKQILLRCKVLDDCEWSAWHFPVDVLTYKIDTIMAAKAKEYFEGNDVYIDAEYCPLDFDTVEEYVQAKLAQDSADWFWEESLPLTYVNSIEEAEQLELAKRSPKWYQDSYYQEG